jgi:pimeloyl-ACP methyl ester carboxylesterase
VGIGELLASAREYRELRSSELWPDRGAPDGHGRSVIVVPGFGVPAATVSPLVRWLRGGGWSVAVPRLGWNVGCGTAAVEVLQQQADAVARTSGRPVAVVGHSRGGLLGRVAAVRAPEAIGTLVTVCTPWSIEPPDRPGVAASTRAVQALRRRGIDVLASVDCAAGPCCAALRREVLQRPAARWVALWSSTDSIGGALSVRPAGAAVSKDLRTSHVGGVLSVAGWRAIGEALAEP